jgi:adenine-specific DNA-methyltransferase
MNYIGSKQRLSDFIVHHISQVVGDLSECVLADLFTGTGIIARTFKSKVKSLITNDIEPYSFALLQHYIGNHELIGRQDELLEMLNNVMPTEGLIFKYYCLGGGENRQYFSDENGKKIDAIRQKITDWQTKAYITQSEYHFLRASLLESADKIANTASVYGAFLKKLKRSAQQAVHLLPAQSEPTQARHMVYAEDSNVLIKNITGDILYLDPPYNARQYGANYHLLNTLALYDDINPQGKTGLRENYYKSPYCQKQKALPALYELIKEAKFKYIFLSYNNEGILSHTQIREIFTTFGSYQVFTTPYLRFKADKDKNRVYKDTKTEEYLHCLVKD